MTDQERAYQLERAAIDTRYTAAQLTRAVEHFRRHQRVAAEAAINRACEGLDRVCEALCPVPVVVVAQREWTAEEILRQEG